MGRPQRLFALRRRHSEMLAEDDLAKILYSELMRNQKASAGLAAKAPHRSAQAEEQAKAPTVAADEVAPLASKRRRLVRDGHCVAFLKETLRDYGVKTTRKKADLLDRLAGLAAEAPHTSARADEQDKAATAAADEVTPLAPKRARIVNSGNQFQCSTRSMFHSFLLN